MNYPENMKIVGVYLFIHLYNVIHSFIYFDIAIYSLYIGSFIYISFTHINIDTHLYS